MNFGMFPKDRISPEKQGSYTEGLSQKGVSVTEHACCLIPDITSGQLCGLLLLH